MEVLSVVCARGGSKGLANKCMRKINGKRVVEYAIDYSLSLGHNTKTVVSTDIEELVRYCEEKGISFIKRDQAISADDSRIDDALANAIAKEGKGFLYCSLVYGNIPIRYPVIFDSALDFLEKNREYDAVFSMQNVEKYHPEWMFDFDEEVLPQNREKHFQRQGLSQKMIHDGHTILFKSELFSQKYHGKMVYKKEYLYSVFGEKIKPLINSEVIVDIDTVKDLKMAEAVLSHRQGG